MTWLTLVILAATALTAVIVALKNAPEGYEDKSGFHFVPRRSAGARVLRSNTHKKIAHLALRQAKAGR